MLCLITTACLVFTTSLAQFTAQELEPLFLGLAQDPTQSTSLNKRVPLSTNDATVAPLIDLQVFAPPFVPTRGAQCEVELLRHSFGQDSYNKPAIVAYAPPSGCGEIGQWAAISMNLSVYSIGTQYDRLSSLYLSHVEIWRSSGAEPTKTGTTWNTVKDVTHYSALFARPGDFMMDFSNIIAPDLLLDGVFDVIVSATFFAATSGFPKPETSEIILPLSTLSDTIANYFTINDDMGGVTNIHIPETTVDAFVEVYASGNSAEEFWYTNVPDEYTSYFPSSSGLIGKGPFREIQVLVDNKLAGFVFPFAVIYTGGITPSNWRPLTSYGAYDQPSYYIDITPFIPTLLASSTTPHSITIRVSGQGTNPSINSNWFVSGSVHIRTGTSKTTGEMTAYEVGDLQIQTTGGGSTGNKTVWTKVTASRKLHIQSELSTSRGNKKVVFDQALEFVNDGQYADDGWIQWTEQLTSGSTVATHQGKQVLRDAFNYPLYVASNYSLYTAEFGAYGSEIKQTYTRALQPPNGPYRAIHSVEHAKGDIGMDNWPGLRHAINGTGETDVQFAYVDGRGQSYFRNIAAKNDGWLRDSVWGTLKAANPPVPDEQIFPHGGPGFRRCIQV